MACFTLNACSPSVQLCRAFYAEAEQAPGYGPVPNQVQTGKRGAPQLYSDTAIATALTLGAVYHLPLRASQGLLASVVRLLHVELPVPHYSTLSGRRANLWVALPQSRGDQPRHVVIDSTGLKVFGEGEWKVRQHGWCKRRTWRKLHLAVDEATGEVLAAQVTDKNMADGQMLPALLERVEGEVEQVSADGSYHPEGTRQSGYEAIAGRGAKTTIPPRKEARIRQHGNCKAPPLARDENLRRIRKVGRARWKEESGYHRRSLAETRVFRMKSIFGPGLSARLCASQKSEALLRCVALNRMTALGMPQSYAV